MEKRQFIRASFKRPVQFQPNPIDVFHGALADDLGTGGIRLNLNKFLPVHTSVTLNFSCGDQQNLLTLNGHVVWVIEIPYSESFQVGIQFDAQGTQSQEEIKQYLQGQLPQVPSYLIR